MSNAHVSTRPALPRLNSAPVPTGEHGAVLSQEQLLAIGEKILLLADVDVVRVQLVHAARSVVRVANNRIMTSDNGDRLELSIELGSGGRAPIRVSTNQVDDASLRSVMQQMNMLARTQFGSSMEYFRVPDGPQNYMPVSLWHDTTVAAMTTVGDSVVPALVRSLTSARLRGSAFVGLLARGTLVLQNDGLSSFCRETDSECVVSARSLDGSSSGWYGQAGRDWSMIRPGEIAERALDFAKRGVHASAVEPGRMTAVLSHFAVAQIMTQMVNQFDAFATDMGGTGFSVRGNPDRTNKIGQHVLDERLMITSDPADPLGGYVPFGDLDYDSTALPTRKMSWVEKGILTDLAYHLYYSLSSGKPFSQSPWSMRLESVAGTPTRTIDEMVAGCERGIYVNRFADVATIDGSTGMQTGVTRDGCFLIRNGKFDRPVKNFRFLESPLLMLNRLEAIGTPERAAMGFVPIKGGEPPYAQEWPRRPMIAPPIMVRDFNFAALSSAV